MSTAPAPIPSEPSMHGEEFTRLHAAVTVDWGPRDAYERSDSSAVRWVKELVTAKGKPPKLALAALMRKILVTLNAMLKARTDWQDPRQR